MPNAETTIQHDMEQQDTGNHNAPGEQGADSFGGTRAGARNVEPEAAPVTNIEKATDVDRVVGLDETLDDAPSINGPAARAPERDEHGRL
jgi:hypothetical protein